MTLLQKLYKYLAKILFSSLINEGTSKMLQPVQELKVQNLEFFPSVLSSSKAGGSKLQ